ncbi:MAG: metal-dependent hydrolase [Planctomycetales bacterium]|nr:metal-dependent hydrolase [Planctomycetales bacterium]
MRVQCLGTTGYHPSPRRHTACYYLPQQGLLLDAGTGMFRLVECLLAEPRDSLDILLSHAHLDHIVGLTFLIDAMAVTPLQRVRLYGAAEKLNAVREHLFSKLIFPVDPPLEFMPLPGDSGTMHLADRGITLEWFPLQHPGGSLGFILSGEQAGIAKRLAYITDTTAHRDAPYIARLRQLDLLLHECYFGDWQQELAEKTGHSCLGAVVDIVRRMRPQRTALIHINPLSEVLGNGFELLPQHTQELHMCVAEDGQLLDL